MPESVTALHLGFHGTPTLARALGAGRSMSFPSPSASVCSLYRSSLNTSSVSTRPPIVCASSEVKTAIVHPLGIMTAADVVKDFYGGINCRDFLAVESLIAEDCVYEDLVFAQPFVGRKAILEFFKKFTKTTSTDLQFVIDDISKEDSLAVGVTWHLEWRRKPFPFSKGCSFYRFEVREGKRQIVYGRDCVEPAVKPGDLALVVIQGVTWLLQKFPQLADRLQ
ncbi:uncharacterized protein LOC122024880 isoform X2 [Zingiber officinale]|uniref:uncharacterized protein LOC122024880 isoform X2 n=1 Tax=Zingiber officinale TaxID=94328 RepID=UPI001C4BD2AC|nr:uncharacterized protein LOC122024880 isoform X2 [Zingiber officinale]